MRTSESESNRNVTDVIDSIFDRRLSEALRLIEADIDDLDAHFSPSQIRAALITASLRARLAGL